jgi:hypothetical protein
MSSPANVQMSRVSDAPLASSRIDSQNRDDSPLLTPDSILVDSSVLENVTDGCVTPSLSKLATTAE